MAYEYESVTFELNSYKMSMHITFYWNCLIFMCNSMENVTKFLLATAVPSKNVSANIKHSRYFH